MLRVYLLPAWYLAHVQPHPVHQEQRRRIIEFSYVLLHPIPVLTNISISESRKNLLQSFVVFSFLFLLFTILVGFILLYFQHLLFSCFIKHFFMFSNFISLFFTKLEIGSCCEVKFRWNLLCSSDQLQNCDAPASALPLSNFIYIFCLYLEKDFLILCSSVSSHLFTLLFFFYSLTLFLLFYHYYYKLCQLSRSDEIGSSSVVQLQKTLC